MNQVWNIFRKDVRHHWIEIAVSLVLVVGFAWAEMNEWTRGAGVITGFGGGVILFGIARGLAVPLLPISWMFLIARVVHGESLAGDRQFWVTRPYVWWQLLVAKTLFVLAFVNVPLFLAQVFLVYKAGFHPTHYLYGLLWLGVMWTLILLIPTAALATVTRNLGQMLLALLFVGLLAIGLSALAEAVPNSSFSGPVVSVNFPLILIAEAVVILLQYSMRRTAQSRWLLGGLAAALTLVLVATPYRTLIAQEYPLAGSNFPLQLSLAGTPSEVHYDMRDGVPVNIPFNLSGLPKDSIVELNGFALTLRNSSGRHWDSGWQSRSQMFFPDDKTLGTNFQIDKNTLERLGSSPMTGDLFLAFTLYHDKDSQTMVVPRGEFSFPGMGFCTPPNPTNSIGSLSCRTAMRRPPFLLVSSEMAASTCPLTKDQLPPKPGEMVHAYVRGTSDPAEFNLSPIIADGITFWQSSTNRVSGICPDTPLTISTPEQTGRSRVVIHLDSAWLAAYLQALGKNKAQAEHPSGDGFAVGVHF